MPWRETTKMEQKIEFINEWISGQFTITELCNHFDISRPTAYKWIKRFEEKGLAGLEELERKPHTHPNKTAPEIEKRIVFYRKKYPRWGGEKIWKFLHHDFDKKLIPTISTVDRILKRNGLIIPRKVRRRIKPVNPIFDPQKCNEVWSADFKGKFKLGNGRYCYPLTIADTKSRFVFAAKGLYGERFKPTKLEFKRVFREFGMPLQIHTDNGTPFGAAQAVCRLTQLAVWFIELGIEPVYSDPGSPQQNGRHERMHKDLKGDATRPPGYNLRAQQRKLNKFVYEYNYVRPHASLDLETPASVHEYSPRPFVEKVEEWVYPDYCEVRRVTKNGALRWRSTQWVMVATSLIDKHVGLEELGEGIWRIYFRQKMLGYFHEKELRIMDELGRLKRNYV